MKQVLLIKNLTKKATILLFLFAFLGAYSQSFLINFPAFSSAPTKNPQDITVSYGTSKLQVQMAASASSATAASVTIQLASGIEYIPGSAVVISTNSGLTITDDGGTPNAPKFKIANALGGITSANNITFTIDRKATCLARTEVLNGTIFKDTVTGTITGSTVSTAVSGSYDVKYAVLSFTQPAAQTNAVTNTVYTRTFSIANGGNGSVNAVYLSVTNTAATVTNSITLTGGSGSAGTPVVLTPTNGVYAIPTANLSGGTFDNGETLEFSENFKVVQCNGVTSYKVGYGPDATPANWCQTVSGSGNVTMDTGAVNLGTFTVAKVGYVNDCTPYQYTFTYANPGNGAIKASTMYDAVFRIGAGVNIMGDSSQYSPFNTPGLLIPGTLLYNGKPITYTVVGTAKTLTINFSNVFTTDPDGAGVGFEDLDGDGFYDDLMPNSTIVFTLNVTRDATLACNQKWSGYWSFLGDITYKDMCGAAKTSTAQRDSHRNVGLTTLTSTTMGEVQSVSDNSYAPSNIYGGQPFRTTFAVGWYAMGTLNYNPNQKYEWEIQLPVGVSVSGTGNIKWTDGKDFAVQTTTTPTYTFDPTTRILKVLSPGPNMGFFKIDLVYDCGQGPGGQGIDITYKVNYINDNVTGCRSSSNIFCGKYTLGRVICGLPICPNGGPAMTLVKVEREDNSLGWTSSAMTTRRLRSAINAYDLSKALLYDDIFINANATQLGITSNNLYVKLVINKYITATDKLAAKSIDVVIKRGGTAIVTTSLPASAASSTGTNSTEQVVIWNLSSILPAGGIAPSDVIETTSHYTVIADGNNLPRYDMQTGKSFSMYNLDSNNQELSCFTLTPEMYLAGTQFGYSSGAIPAINGCTTTSIPLTAYRNFDTNGNRYSDEFRPGFMPTAMDLFLADGLTIANLYGAGYSVADLTPTSITPVAGGKMYHYDFSTLKGHEISLYVATSYALTVDIKANCSATSGGSVSYKIYGQDYYYHYKDLPSPNQDTNTFPTSAVVNFAYNLSTKPAISISNQSGTVQASKPTESATVRVASTGGSTAPYIWFSVPNQPGVTVTQVVDIATGAVATPIAYVQGSWFKISAAGLPQGTSKDYRVDFTYTTCTPSKLHIEAGWDCADYPTDPTAFLCAPSTADLPFNPIAGEVQVSSVSQPISPLLGLCTPLNYEFRVNSAGGGNIKDLKFGITQVTGITATPSSIQAEYPAGAGNWAAVTSTVSGNEIIVNLTSHPAYPSNGVPGTLNDGGVAAKRMFGVRFSVTTDCNFVSGSNFMVTPYANNSCGSATTGSGASVASNSISVTGADPKYLISSTINVNPASTFSSCSSQITLPIEQMITALNPTGTTGTVRIDLPAGYDFAGTINCSSPFCPTVQGVYTDATTSTRYMVLKVPAGMASGDKMVYTVDIVNAAGAPITCGAHQIKIRGYDKAGNISCPSAPGGVCSDVTVQTGKLDFDFTVDKPAYTINTVSGSPSGTAFTGTISVKNTTNFATTGNINVNFYCADALGNPTTTLLGTATLSSIAANSTSVQNYSFTPIAGVTCSSGKIVAVIEQANNCVCSPSNGVAFTTSCYKPGLTTGGATLATNHGITALGRAGSQNSDNWPMVRKGAWTVLEAKTKGFVPNRLTDVQMAAIPSAELKEGMMIYNITQQCLMININGTASGWKCYVTPACPD